MSLGKLKSALWPVAKKLLYTGNKRWCPVCERSASKFRPHSPHGLFTRYDAKCPWCTSLERHRLLITFLRNNTNLFDGQPKRMLHIAPEVSLEPLFRNAEGIDYLSGDLNPARAMEVVDVTDIQYPENTFDVVYCSHVLEHVPDDRKAMREFLRVLKPGGWAVINVPILSEKTIEDPSITDPEERIRLFGQHDHVRSYGPDYENRLAEEGFKVTRYGPSDVVSQEDITRMGLTNKLAGDVYYCEKDSA